MSKLESLKSASSLRDLAILLGVWPSHLSYVLYVKPGPKYTAFEIPKRSGGSRTIQAPHQALKVVQRRLSDLLQDCIAEIQERDNIQDRIAHGFVRKKSIVTNACRHRNRRWVFNMDLEDFFPSINFGRVRGFLLKNRDFELQESVATVIAQIACHDNSLPQGSPCSPVFSNLIGHVMDIRLVHLASKAGCIYTRYADDLTFSTNKAHFPSEVAEPTDMNDVGVQIWVPSEGLRSVIYRSGFQINAKKTRMMYRYSRQEVTGLVVNQKINVPREYRRTVRAMVHRLTTTGEFHVPITGFGGTIGTLLQRPGTWNQLGGMLGFVHSIDECRRLDVERRTSKEKPYLDFLMYSVFYAAQMPVILCEGKTDNVYITHAIRQLAPDFPDLAEGRSANNIRLKVRLYKYATSSTRWILGLGDGGTGPLAMFIAKYKERVQRFRGNAPSNPVIVVYDNDSGAKPIKNAIGKYRPKTGTQRPFTHIYQNMYAVAIPRADSMIEHLFDSGVQAKRVAEKIFKPEKKGFDPDKHYGKAVFAHKVVARNARQIGFEGFRPLLSHIVSAIEDFRLHSTKGTRLK